MCRQSKDPSSQGRGEVAEELAQALVEELKLNRIKQGLDAAAAELARSRTTSGFNALGHVYAARRSYEALLKFIEEALELALKRG